MANRTIRITDEAYDRLVFIRKEGESFSDVIIRITQEPSLMQLAGTLSDESANAIKKSIAELRRRSQAELVQRHRRLWRQFSKSD